VGSLSTLPYALAEAEQNFLIPDADPGADLGRPGAADDPERQDPALVERHARRKLHWVGLHLRYGRELLAEAALDAELRAQVLDSLSLLAAPGAHPRGGALARAGRGEGCRGARDALGAVLLAREVGAQALRATSSCLLAELRAWPGLAQGSELRRHLARLRHAQADAGQFLRAGAAQPAHLPHPDGLLQPHHGGELGIEHPVLGGPGRRTGVSPAQLNVRIPEWTQKLVEQIFASHLEDWPAVLKSLRLVGDDVRARARALAPAEGIPAIVGITNR
jgi:hypothetical protein